MNFLKEVKEEREHMPLEPLTLKMERHVYVHAYIRVQAGVLLQILQQSLTITMMLQYIFHQFAVHTV